LHELEAPAISGPCPTIAHIKKHAEKQSEAVDFWHMTMAMLYPDPERGKRTDLSSNSDKLTRSEHNYLSMARKVLRILPSVASEVINGGPFLFGYN
jgi:hypothetical protein